MFTLNLTGPSHVNRAASPVYRRRPLDSSDSDDDTAPVVNTFGMLPDSTPPLPHWMRQQDSITEQPIPPTVVPIASLQHHSTQSGEESEEDEPPRRKRQRKTTSRRRKRARAAAQFFDLEAGVDGDASADEEDDQPNQADLDFIAPDDCFD